jgi:sulfane dehydrogenase subunit SoxC
MTAATVKFAGRIAKAPEGNLSPAQFELARKARRQFMGKALAFGAGVAGTPIARAAAGEGDAAILELPEHSKGLGCRS